MLNLMLLNGERDPRFLTGGEEAEAFKKKEFIRMNSSTISKVEFFRHIINLSRRGKLHTSGTKIINYVDRLLESRWSRLVALSMSFVGALTLCYGVVRSILIILHI